MKIADVCAVSLEEISFFDLMIVTFTMFTIQYNSIQYSRIQ